MYAPRKTCKKCGKGFTGEGNVCFYCKTGKERPKSNLLNLTKLKEVLRE
jgi:hypothetical protein